MVEKFYVKVSSSFIWITYILDEVKNLSGFSLKSFVFYDKNICVEGEMKLEKCYINVCRVCFHKRNSISQNDWTAWLVPGFEVAHDAFRSYLVPNCQAFVDVMFGIC